MCSMERRVRGNSHARCGPGENPEITSKDYLSVYDQDENDFAVFREMYGPEIIFASLDEIEDELTRILQRYFH